MTKTNYRYYFAYGSNMCTNRLRERAPSCNFVAVGAVPRYILKFHKKSKDGSGKCNAYYTGNEQDTIIGAIFDIDPADKRKLENAEGLGSGYHEKEVKVYYKQGNIKAFMYEADDWAIDDSLQPYTWYKDFVVQGAKEHNLPEDYIKELEAVPSNINRTE